MTQEKTHYWRPWVEPIIEDSKRSLSRRTPKRTLSLKSLKKTLSLWNLKGTYQWGPSGTSAPSMTFAPQRTFFGFLVMVYHRVGYGDKFFKILILEGSVFILPVTKKLKLKNFSSKHYCYNIIPEYHIIATKTFLKFLLVAQIFFCK